MHMDAYVPWLHNLSQHMVGRALANQYDVLLAIADIARGKSLSEVANKYGFTRMRMDGYVNRIKKLAGSFRWEQKYLFLFDKFLDMQIEPTIIHTSPLYCTLCGTHILYQSPLVHIITRHKKIVRDLTEEFIEYVLSTHNNGGIGHG